jgi:hypothetical protein
VAWTSVVPGGGFYTLRIRAARVSPAGIVLDDPPIDVFTFQNAGAASLALASDGASWTLAWSGTGAGDRDVRAARIASTGEVLDAGGVIVAVDAGTSRTALDLAFASATYLLVWQERRTGSDDVMGLRLSAALAPLDPAPNAVAGDPLVDEVAPQVASDGSGFFVVWESCPGAPPGCEVRGSGVTAAGDVLVPGGRAISGPVGLAVGRSPCVAWAGDWFVAWKTPGISVARVTTEGEVLPVGGILLDAEFSETKDEPEIAALAAGVAHVVWTDYRAGGAEAGDIYSTPVTSVGQPSAGRCISLGAPRQAAPRLASDGWGFMAVFSSEISGERRVLLEPFDRNGEPLLQEPVVVASGARLAAPALASNGAIYVVAWGDEESETIRARRVLPDGTFLDSAAVAVMPGLEPDVASLGIDFLIVGTTATADPNVRTPFARRLRAADGALLDPSPVLLGLLGNYHAVAPRVCALQNRWLVVWEQRTSSAALQSIVCGGLVGPDGVPSPEFLIFEDLTKARFHQIPAVAATGSCALVAWQDRPPGASETDVLARRVLPDGSLLDAVEIPVSVAGGSQGRPAVAWDGQQFLVGYDDARANAFFLDMRSDVFAARVTEAGQVADPGGFPVAAGAAHQTSAALAVAEGAKGVIGVADFVAGAPFASLRIGVRTFTPTGGTSAETGVAGAAAGAPSGVLLASPNPSPGAATLSFRNEGGGRVSLIIYDVAGRAVRTLLDGDLPAGPVSILWDGRDANERAVPPGVYLVRVRGAGTRLSGKIVLR